MKSHITTIHTEGKGFYNISKEINHALAMQLGQIRSNIQDGLLHLFLQHTSCGLTINESFDPNAKKDLELFTEHLAPENLSFISHTDEGSDDSPAHMKTLIIGHTLQIPVENGKLLLGRWQGIFLCEFRSLGRSRHIISKLMPDQF